MELHAVGYCRVSTHEQVRDGVSLQTQQKRIRAHCDARDLDFVRCYEDKGRSGRKAANRPGLEAAISDAIERRGVLVVYSLSRLARSVRDCIDIASRIERAGAELVLLNDNIDTSTATGRVFFHIIAALAQFESDLNGERVRAALDYTRKQGRRYCRNAPYGYRFCNGMIEQDADEQRVIRRIASLRERGRSYRQIQSELERAGVLNRRRNPLTYQAIAKIHSQLQEDGIRRPAVKRRRGQ